MRSSSRQWFHARVAVPLTGREPVLGRLETRLAHRGPGWGFLVLRGPRGSGISRLLDEAALLLTRDLDTPPLRIGVASAAAPPMEVLRRALRAFFGRSSRAQVERALGAVLAAREGSTSAVASWVFDGPVYGARPPDPDVIRRVLRALAPGGPILVDDLDRLDVATRTVLLGERERKGLGLLAGTSHQEGSGDATADWELEPLSLGQIELLLRRWLRHPVTVRRLAPELLDRSQGWPGRVVRLARHLGRSGVLTATSRGVTIKRWPPDWPDGRQPTVDFEAWLGGRSTAERAVLEAASVQGRAPDVETTARGAGVKTRVVDDLLEEVRASWPEAEGDLFPDAAGRRLVRVRMGEERRRTLARRLLRAWRRHPIEEDRGVREHAQRLRVCLAAEAFPEAQAALHAMLARLGHGGAPARSTLDLVARAAHALVTASAPDRATLGAIVSSADLLHARGRPDDAVRVIDAAREATGSDQVDDLALLWRDAARRDSSEARDAATLEAALAQLDERTPADERYDAWHALAEIRRRQGDPERARAAWRQALVHLPAGDVVRMAAAHQGLAHLAGTQERPRAQAAHLRTAARLHVALGRYGPAADAWRGRAEVLTTVGLPARALDAWLRAAAGFHVSGSRVDEVRALHRAGFLCVRLAAYDRAVDLLEQALRRVEDPDGTEVSQAASLHLALALAHHGRGDGEGESRHASAACTEAAPEDVRLSARALLIRAGVRVGDGASTESLPEVERALSEAGLELEAREARRVRLDAHLRAGNAARAQSLVAGREQEPGARLREARLLLLVGRSRDGRRALDALARDPAIGVGLRVEAYARLAHASLRAGDPSAARRAAKAASGLLEVGRRSRAEDARIHRMLALTFRALGEDARSAGHRDASRRTSERSGNGHDRGEAQTDRRELIKADPRRARA